MGTQLSISASNQQIGTNFSLEDEPPSSFYSSKRVSSPSNANNNNTGSSAHASCGTPLDSAVSALLGANYAASDNFLTRLMEGVGQLLAVPAASIGLVSSPYTVGDGLVEDGWFGQAVTNLDEVDAHYLELHSDLIKELLARRRGLSIKESELHRAMQALASRECDPISMHVLSKLGELHDKLALSEYHKAEAVACQVEAPLKEQLDVSQTQLKGLFSRRVSLWKAWQSQLDSLAKSRETKQRLIRAGRGESARVKTIEGEIDKGVETVLRLESEFLAISEALRNEYLRYTRQRREDVKATIIAYLELLIENEATVLSYWEAFGAEVAIVNEPAVNSPSS